MGKETFEKCDKIGGEHSRAATWAFGELPVGHETCEGCVEIQGDDDDDDDDYNDDGDGR